MAGGVERSAPRMSSSRVASVSSAHAIAARAVCSPAEIVMTQYI